MFFAFILSVFIICSLKIILKTLLCHHHEHLVEADLLTWCLELSVDHHLSQQKY